jgi:hypothetical protein
VYRFYVHNLRDYPVKATLRFTENDHQTVNLQWPRSGNKCIVYPKQTKTLILIPKVIPQETPEGDILEIDKLTIEFLWKEKIRDYSNNRSQVHPSNQNLHITTSQDYGRKGNSPTVPKI